MTIVKVIGPGSGLPDEGFNNYLSEEGKITVPFTQIQDRAQILNLSSDGGTRLGINRIMTSNISKKSSEVGPNGEIVYGVNGDKYDQIRFVGDWASFNTSNGHYVGVNTAADTTSYVEVTFYGTGINLIRHYDTNNGSYVSSIDGGVESSNLYDPNLSSVINARGYKMNSVLPLYSGLTAGVHTLKIRNDNATTNPMIVFGFEILNESTQLDIRPTTGYVRGGTVDISQATLDYNAGFTNQYGSAGTKGGTVVLYSNDSGSVLKDIQWTDITQNNLGSTDHSNEEIIRKINYREFGTGRVDDFSSITSSSNRTFTLDDGTTTLFCRSGRGDQFDSIGLAIDNSAANYQNITFVGTGLDILVNNDGSTRTWQNVYIDGVDIGTLTSTVDGEETLRVVSGLSYGTHTARFQNPNITSAAIVDFIIYAPKKPELTDDQLELASYHLMGDYSFAPANGTLDDNFMSQGVIQKHPGREFNYSGSGAWGEDLVNPAYPNGGETFNNSSGATVEYAFWGTGFDFYEWNQSHEIDVELDDGSGYVALTDANFPSISGLTAVSGLTFNEATGRISIPASGGGISRNLSVPGLPLGFYKVRFTSVGTRIDFLGLNIHTPIHSYKQDMPVQQSSLDIGSCALSDSRKFKAVDSDNELPNWVTVGPAFSSNATTTSTSFIPMPNMQGVIRTNGNPLEIDFTTHVGNSVAGSYAIFEVRVDGKSITQPFIGQIQPSGNQTYTENVHISTIVNLDAGIHNVQVFWRVTSGQARIDYGTQMNIRELK